MKTYVWQEHKFRLHEYMFEIIPSTLHVWVLTTTIKCRSVHFNVGTRKPHLQPLHGHAPPSLNYDSQFLFLFNP